MERTGLTPPDVPAAGLPLSLLPCPRWSWDPRSGRAGDASQEPREWLFSGSSQGPGKVGGIQGAHPGAFPVGPPLGGHCRGVQPAAGLLTQLARQLRDLPWGRPCKRR